jgi:lipopolysaccharide assembly outer membrane protein LptD (OstA)
LHAKENIKKIEIYATDMNTKNDIINISGGIAVVYGDYILISKKAKYDKKNGILELFEDVKVSNGKQRLYHH